MEEGSTVVLRGHTGFWIGLNKDNEIVCNKADRASAATFIVGECSTKNSGSTVRHGSQIDLQLKSELFSQDLFLAVGTDGSVTLQPRKPSPLHFSDTQFSILTHEFDVAMSGMALQLQSVSNGKSVEVVGEIVRGRAEDHSTLQRMVLEKVPVIPMSPVASSQQHFLLEDKAWLLRQGVQYALVDKQELAKFLSSHLEGRQPLLNAYARVWGREWSESQLIERTNSNTPPRSARKLSARKIYDMFAFTGGVSEKDRANADAFVNALRSFFALALRMSQLEARCVERIVEAFAAALAADTTFMDVFSASMLPVKDRKTYSKPEDMIFGLAYFTTMLNTDLHNQQVAQKILELNKFITMGKDCGMTNGFMLQVYRNIQKEEL